MCRIRSWILVASISAVVAGGCTDEPTTEAIAREAESIDPLLPSGVEVAEVARRTLRDGSVQVHYQVTFEGVPIYGLGRRATLVDGVARWPRTLSFGKDALTPGRDDSGDGLAKDVALAAWKPWDKTVAPVVTSVSRVYIPDLAPGPGTVEVRALAIGYVVEVAESPEPVRQRMIYVIGGDGTLREAIDPREFSTGLGNSFHAGQVNIEVANINTTSGWRVTLNDRRYAATTGGIWTTNYVDGNCNLGCGIAPYYSADNEFGTGMYATNDTRSGPDGETSAVDVHRAIGLYWDLMDAVYGRVGPLDDDVSIDAIVNIDPVQQNLDVTSAWFDPGFVLVNGHRGMLNFTVPGRAGDTPLTTVEAVAHELTHGLFFEEVLPGSTGIANSHPSKPLSEGLSDVFGMMTKFWADAGGSPAIPNVGGVWVIGDQPGHVARYFHKPSRDRLQLPTGEWVQSDDAYPPIAEDGHKSGGIVRRAFYFLAQGAAVRSPLPWLQWYWEEYGSPFLERGFLGVGNDAATLMFYTAIVHEMDDEPDLHELRRSVVATAEQLYGHCSIEHKAAVDAFAAVNLGSPADRDAIDGTISVYQTSGTILVTTNVYATATRTTISVDGVVVASSGLTAGWVQTVLPRSLFPQVQATEYNFTLTIEDDCNNVTTRSVHAPIDVSGPQLDFIELPGPAPRTKVLQIAASDPAGLVGAAYSIGASWFPAVFVLSGISSSHTWTLDYAAQPHGPSTFTVSARDALGNTTTKVVPTFFDKQPPTCSTSIGYQSDGAVGVQVWARDDTRPEIATARLDSDLPQTKPFLATTVSNLYIADFLLFAAVVGDHIINAECADAYQNVSHADLPVIISRSPRIVAFATTSLSRQEVVLRAEMSDDLGVREWAMKLQCGASIEVSDAIPATTHLIVSRSFSLSSFAPGTVCEASLSVWDAQGLLQRSWFSFNVPSPPSPPSPPPTIVWLTESEPNTTWAEADVVASSITGIRGTVTGPTINGTTADIFRIELAPGAGFTWGGAIPVWVGSHYCVHSEVTLEHGETPPDNEKSYPSVPSGWTGIDDVDRWTNRSGATRSYFIRAYRLQSEAFRCDGENFPYEFRIRR